MTANDFLSNEKWVKRLENGFDFLDADKDGLITINDLVPDIKKLATFSSDSAVIERFRLAFLERAAAFGVKPGISVTKEEIVKNVAATAEREIKSDKRGEGSLVHRFLNALFDLVGTEDPWTITLQEYLSGTKFLGIPQIAGESIFNSLDTEKTGKLEKMDLIRHKFNLLFSLEAPGWAEMFSAIKPQ